MTVIVYRDGVLASDSLVITNGTRSGSVRKVVKGKRGHLAGAAGKVGHAFKFLEWIENGAYGKAPQGDINGLMVKPDGSVGSFDPTAVFVPCSETYVVAGSGADFALGALAVGASASEAVRAAIEWETSCGGDVQTVELDPTAAKASKAKKKGKRK